MQHHFDIEIAEQIGVQAAVIYDNIRHWVVKNKANEVNIHDGYAWSYNSVKAFSEIFPYLSDKQIRTALDKLEQAGLIKSGEFNKNRYDRTKWYTTNDGKIGGTSNEPKGQIDLPKRATQVAQKGEPIPDIKPDINTCTPPIVPPEGDAEAMTQKPKHGKKANMKLTAQTYALGETELEKTICDYIDYRLTKDGKAFTEHALNLALKKLDTLTRSPSEKIAIIEQTICNGWSGLFPIDRNKQQTPQAPREFVPIIDNKDWNI